MPPKKSKGQYCTECKTYKNLTEFFQNEEVCSSCYFVELDECHKTLTIENRGVCDKCGIERAIIYNEDTDLVYCQKCITTHICDECGIECLTIYGEEIEMTLCVDCYDNLHNCNKCGKSVDYPVFELCDDCKIEPPTICK